MTDWSKDPVFGDVALRVRPCASLGLLPDPVHAMSRARPRACIVEVDPSALQPSDIELLGDRLVGTDSVLCDVEELRELRQDRPAIAAVVEAAERAARHPAPPRILGVVNVTPDSFSDGGAFLDPARAIEHGLELVRDGADVLDVGGESTRPGSEPIDERQELRRVLPVVQGLAERARVPISVDTTKSTVARECLAAGAAIVNDVSAGRFDPRMLDVVARAQAGFVAMHMLGTPRDMQQAPRYDDVVGEVLEFLRARCRAALEAGVDRSKLWIDPGIGFGKTLEHNVALLRSTNQLRSLGLPVLVGPSRKAFVAAIEERAGLPRSEPHARLGGTLAALTVAVQNGAEILRVHDVREAKQAALVARALVPWNRDASGT